MNEFQELQQMAEESLVTHPRRSKLTQIPLNNKSIIATMPGKKEFAAEDRKKVIESLRYKMLTRTKPTGNRLENGLQELELLIPESEHATIDARLVICEPCEKLQPDGCSDCSSCSSRFNASVKKVEEGSCKRFEASPEAKYQSKPETNSNPNRAARQPQRKVNDMFVYLYETTYVTAEEPTKKKSIRVVAQGLAAVLAAVEKAVPGATVLGAPAGQPVDAIADGIITSEIEIAPRQATQPRVGPGGPGGIPNGMGGPGGMLPAGMVMTPRGPMPAEQAASMGLAAE